MRTDEGASETRKAIRMTYMLCAHKAGGINWRKSILVTAVVPVIHHESPFCIRPLIRHLMYHPHRTAASDEAGLGTFSYHQSKEP